MTDHAMAIEDIDKALAAESCGDSSCTTSRPRGMHTNGGCRCPWAGRGDMPKETAMKMRRVLSLLRFKIQRLEALKAGGA